MCLPSIVYETHVRCKDLKNFGQEYDCIEGRDRKFGSFRKLLTENCSQC